MEHNNEGVEDDFPLQRGDFQVPAVNFSGVYIGGLSYDLKLDFVP